MVDSFNPDNIKEETDDTLDDFFEENEEKDKEKFAYKKKQAYCWLNGNDDIYC